MKEIQARNRGRKNQIIRFWIPEYLVFPKHIEFE
jgi:hypothetical protein